jgi:eukaryotic-like serine/threonine-protein kinase
MWPAKVAPNNCICGRWRVSTPSLSPAPRARSNRSFLLTAKESGFSRAPFDFQRLVVTGPAVLAVEDVLQAGGVAAQYGISSTGSLVYARRGGAAAQRHLLVWVDRQGREQTLPGAARSYGMPRLSPVDQRVAVGLEGNIWIDDLVRNAFTKLTVQGRGKGMPVWTPDGKRIVFYLATEGRVNVFWQRADGSGGPERLTSGEDGQFPNSLSPDGQRLAFTELSATTGYDLWVQRIGDDAAQKFLQTSANEFAAQFSPDGRWLAYTSDESGRNEIYVRPYPGPGGKLQVSSDGRTEAMWNRNGRELFYRSGSMRCRCPPHKSTSCSTGAKS